VIWARLFRRQEDVEAAPRVGDGGRSLRAHVCCNGHLGEFDALPGEFIEPTAMISDGNIGVEREQECLGGSLVGHERYAVVT
jgi:hypothetical protein